MSAGKVRLVVVLACLALAACGSAGRLVSTSSLSPEEQDARREAYRTPGVHHERMTRHIGSWSWTLRSWSEPGAEPAVSEGSSTFQLGLEGLFIEESARGSIQGMPFAGEGRLGYDNAAGEYMSFWIDSTGTGMALFRGRCSGRCNVITMRGEAMDPVTGRSRPAKLVYRWEDDDTFRVESWSEPTDGPAVRLTEVVYTRS